MYISIFYVLTHLFFVKNGYSSWPMQKRQKMCHKKAYFSAEFCHFYIDHIKSWVCLKRLPEHVEHEDVHITFLFNFFQIYQNCISNKGCICTREQKKCHVHISHLC
jgi:hypothetical protein